MNKLIYFSLTLLALTACGRSKQPTDTEEQEKLVNEKNAKIISELANKYSIKYSLDTLRYNYTIQFNDLLNTDFQMITQFQIRDIYNNDSISFVKIETRSCYLNLIIPETEQQKLLTLDKSYYGQANAVMIVNLQEIKKIDLTLESYYEDQDYCSIEFESSRGFVGKGQVIEIQTLNE